MIEAVRGLAPQFVRELVRAAKVFRDSAAEEVLVVHHNDVDGLTSGAILGAVVERSGRVLRRVCLEKPYPAVMRELLADPFEGRSGLVIIADFGSGTLPEIVSMKQGEYPVLVLDHHGVTPATAPWLFVANLRQSIPLGGESWCSASGTCALFGVLVDDENKDLAHLGVLGAIGDSMLDDSGRVVEISRVLEENAAGRVSFSGGSYLISLGDERPRGAKELCAMVNALGSLGYFECGPDVGIKALREGFGEAATRIAARYEERLGSLIATELAPERHAEEVLGGSGLRFVTFSVGGDITHAVPEAGGVKTVGLLCEELIRRAGADIVLGAQRIPPVVPGVGTVRLSEVKISMRIHPRHREVLASGTFPRLRDIMPRAAAAVGGFADGCHDAAGAVTVAPERVGEFVHQIKVAMQK